MTWRLAMRPVERALDNTGLGRMCDLYASSAGAMAHHFHRSTFSSIRPKLGHVRLIDLNMPRVDGDELFKQMSGAVEAAVDTDSGRQDLDTM